MALELPGATPQVVSDGLDVHRLVAYLRSEARTRPVVVLTVAHGRQNPYVNPGDFLADGRADVVTLTHDRVTYAFSDVVGKEASVYGGACRVYPPGTDWETDPHSIPLFLARGTREIKDLRGLLRDALRSALAPPPTPAAPPTPPTAPRSHGIPGTQSLPPTVRTRDEAAALGVFLRSSTRQRPVVVVSRATGTVEAYADVESLRSTLRGIADVAEIETPEASWAFSEAVPPMCQVYGGASRVYPIGHGWETDPYESPLRFAYGRTDRVRITRELVSDAMSMSSAGGFVADAAVERAAVQVSGTVSGVAGGRALVNVGGGLPCVIWPELVEPGVAAERLFRRGMPVRGELDPESRRLDVRGMRRRAEDAVASYEPGDTVLARVAAVDAEGCTVELYPGFTRTIAADLLTEDGKDLRLLLSEGDVVPVWFGERDQGSGEWLLSMLDAAAPEEAATAPSILDGGPPWLVAEQISEQPAAQETEALEAEAPSAVDAEAPPAVGAPEATPDVVEGLLRDQLQLVEELRRTRADLAREQDEARELRRQLREEVRRKKSRARPSVPDEVLFATEDGQLDFEIRQHWAYTVPVGEKERYPLAAWRYGPGFFDTLGAVHGVSRTKVVEVLVQVLTGRDAELASRELHQLRSGKGGDDAPVTRNGGETCWRVSLQSNTPSARRLHYWKCADGTVEFSSVRLHDDVRP
ncbi:hypothetical protein H5399_01320 [Tessaracoccus sp. MC1627]|uniref:hypothetical protein n=1 Tax=Tessaracoccus sp. MC1627 TaxID=2760312 RepID=UPI0015FF1496|nr:hypothetical protein [Tessaracoccus sp. MC1627]MBB1511252.1 hypothetical protein [Tessaracoccus sp. MC1627]